mgnify:CR=1 FL=1
MTHKDALTKVMVEQNISKAELARRCGYESGAAAIIPRFNNDIQISKLIAMANALGYEIVMQPIPDNPDMRPAAQLVLDSIPKKKKAMEARPASDAKEC